MEPIIQVLLTKTGIQYLESGIRALKSRIQECLGFPNMEWSTLSKRKDEPLPSKNIRLESQTKRQCMWTQLNWMQWPSENDNEKVYFGCVDKTLILLVHPRNCPLVPVDDFPVSCGCYVYLLVISQSLDSILWYIYYLHFTTLFLHYIFSFLLCV